MSVILREVIPDGTQWGRLGEVLLDWTELEFGQDLKNPSSIMFKYPIDGVNYNKLKEGMYVVPVVNGNHTWRDSYFWVREKNGSPMPNAESKVATFGGVSLRGRLDKVRWLPAVGSEYMDSDMFRYHNVTPGTVIKGGVENYLSRARNVYNDPTNWITGVGVSPDAHWFFRVDEEVEPTTSVMQMITKYQDLGIATASFNGFLLQTAHYFWYAYDPTSTGTHIRDLSDEVSLVVGQNLLNGEEAWSHTDLITALLVVGGQDPFSDNPEVYSNSVQWVTAPQKVIDKWGYHESVLNVPDAHVHSTLKALGEAYIRRHMEPRYSTTYTMASDLYDSRGNPKPFPRALVDFQCGDLISVITHRGVTKERVHSITLTYPRPNTPQVGLTLNDYFESEIEVFDQRLRRLGG